MIENCTEIDKETYKVSIGSYEWAVCKLLEGNYKVWDVTRTDNHFYRLTDFGSIQLVIRTFYDWGVDECPVIADAFEMNRKGKYELF